MPKVEKSVIVSSGFIADLFGVQTQSIADWVTRGLPKIAHGKFDLKVAFDWWQENINTDPADATTSDARG